MGDPSSHMDELLKAYARKRREEGGEPPRLHSATRHRLQEEVRRVYAEPAPAAPPWYARFLLRPAMAGALALAAIAVGLFVALWPQARLPERAAFTGQEAPAVTSAPAPATGGALDRKSAREHVAADAATVPPKPVAAEKALARAETLPAAPSSRADTFALSSATPQALAAKEGLLARDEVREETRAAPSPAVRGSPLAKQEVPDGFLFQNARFLNQAPARGNLAAAAAVLTSFRITRIGNDVVLVDADGSVYRGSVETAAADADKGRGLKEDSRRSQAEAKSRGGASLPFAFRVSGTNATLRQAIEIAARYAPEEAQAANAQLGAALAFSNQAANALDYQDNRSRQGQNAPVPRGRIQGRARLADQSEVELDALAASPP